MKRETVWRARTIVKRGEIRLKDASPGFFHFQVKQRNEQWTDVWLTRKKTGELEWSCNAVTRKKNGDSWGCVMNVNVDKGKSYCSHTLAAQIYLKQIGVDINAGKKD